MISIITFLLLQFLRLEIMLNEKGFFLTVRFLFIKRRINTKSFKQISPDILFELQKIRMIKNIFFQLLKKTIIKPLEIKAFQNYEKAYYASFYNTCAFLRVFLQKNSNLSDDRYLLINVENISALQINIKCIASIRIANIIIVAIKNYRDVFRLIKGGMKYRASNTQHAESFAGEYSPNDRS